jgi:transcriptional regulator with PAS, ATPase and Fis domain
VLSGDDDMLAAFDALLERVKQQSPDLLAELRGRLDQVTADALADADPAPDEGFHGLIGECDKMLELRRLIERFAKADAAVLLTGESGTGKERVAQALHRLSRRVGGPFVAENCAAIPDTLLESVLFGHKKGAFTGAIKDHPGHFLAAHRGTLLLDEIGEMPLPLQAKLLRTLQEGEVRAVGDNKVRKIDVRVIAATNQNLEAAVAAGRFREDLYYRLNVLRLELPPLRDRDDDVLLLARRFLAVAAQKAGRALALSPSAEAALRSARWPGNVRQLQNEMQRTAALCEGPEVAAADLSADVRGS